jgi:hypothetical protein
VRCTSWAGCFREEAFSEVGRDKDYWAADPLRDRRSPSAITTYPRDRSLMSGADDQELGLGARCLENRHGAALGHVEEHPLGVVQGVQN